MQQMGDEHTVLLSLGSEGPRKAASWLGALVVGLLALGCESGGVGDPCVPEDEYQTNFSGFAVTEVNVESRSFQCETRICLVNHFQGRVSCKYGQAEGESHCKIPGQDDPITVPVDPQLRDRQTDKAVYCSCRCDGPDPNARYCECPSGYACTELVDDLGIGTGGQLAGSYCVKDRTQYDPKNPPTGTCTASNADKTDGDCGPEYGFEEVE